eukprot:tig00000658_g2925.t1
MRLGVAGARPKLRFRRVAKAPPTPAERSADAGSAPASRESRVGRVSEGRQDVDPRVRECLVSAFGVDIGDDAYGGKKLVARRVFARGDVVLRSRPLAHLLHPADGPRAHCDVCFARIEFEAEGLGATPRECGCCRVVCYCSPDHEAQAAPRHREECAAFCAIRAGAAADAGVPEAERGPAAFRLLALFRLLAAAAAGWSAGPSVEEPSFRSLASHRTGGTSASGVAVHVERLAAALMRHLPPELRPPCTPDEIEDAAGRALANGFTIYDHGEDPPVPIGHGMYPLAAFCNHSCNPSCAWAFEGPELAFRALRDIKEGEEITIAYHDTLLPGEERREAMARKFPLFTCRCDRCRGTDPTAARADALLGGFACPARCLPGPDAGLALPAAASGAVQCEARPFKPDPVRSERAPTSAAQACGARRDAAEARAAERAAGAAVAAAEREGGGALPTAAAAVEAAGLHPAHRLSLRLARLLRDDAARRHEWEAAAGHARIAAAASGLLSSLLPDALTHADLAALGAIERARGRHADAADAYRRAAEVGPS